MNRLGIKTRPALRGLRHDPTGVLVKLHERPRASRARRSATTTQQPSVPARDVALNARRNLCA